LVSLIGAAVKQGSRVKPACHISGISYRSYLRWKTDIVIDQRKGSIKNVPRRLSKDESELFYEVANQKEYRELTPGQVVASLLDKEVYYGSERTLYRILKSHNALVNRSETRKPSRYQKPPELIAIGPNQVWSWDITWLKTDIKGIFLYAYVIIDIFSRKIVGWSIEKSESPDLAKSLYRRILSRGNVRPRFVHSDNGGPMKGLSLVAFLTQMQVGLSFSRPRVSDDNPFIESFFKTVKYHVSYPKAFTDISMARKWFADFINWYNERHQHSALGYVTPQQKHSGDDLNLFKKRQEVLNRAAVSHPERFVSGARKVQPERVVILNRVA
jgi:putative transposase